MVRQFWILCFVALALSGCSVSVDNFPRPDELRIAIAQSISIPFESNDTLVYDSFIGICGNSSQDELNRYYEPHLNELPYLSILRTRYAGPVVVTGDSLYNVMMSRFETDRPDCASPWDCFSKDKIRLSIFGEAISNSSVKIYEFYGYNGQDRSLEKVFVYGDAGWKCQTIKGR